MTKGPLKRISEQILDEDGNLREPKIIHLDQGANLDVTEFVRSSRRVRLSIRNWWFTKRALDELIAELLFIKEEIDNHPYFLEKEQEEDQEEIIEDELDEEELDWEPEPPFEEEEENIPEDAPDPEVIQPRVGPRYVPLRFMDAPIRPHHFHHYDDND